jgi:hypothetical protein
VSDVRQNIQAKKIKDGAQITAIVCENPSKENIVIAPLSSRFLFWLCKIPS